jgi:hypothetical protein
VCPDCWAGRRARALVAGDHFWLNLALMLLPFVVVALVTWAVHRRLARADGAG